MEFLKPSDLILSRNPKKFVKERYLPFDQVPLGMSFRIVKGVRPEMNEVRNIELMRVLASREGIKLGRLFAVADHGDCFEVYYEAERPEGPKQKAKKPPKTTKVKESDESNQISPKPLQHWLTLTCPACGETNTSLPVEEFLREMSDKPDTVETRCMDCEHIWQQPRANFEEA